MKLAKPIQAHGQTCTELTFREPTGTDLARDGFPYKYEQSGGVIMKMFDTAAVGRLISSLAAIPMSSVGQLSALDFTRAMGEVLDFFKDVETPPTS